jgi:membrane-bound inhibitor of C-type lysozyme
MLHGNRISRLAGVTLAAALLGLTACTGETAEQETADDAAAEMAGAPDSAGMENTAQAPHEVSIVAYECADGGTFTLTIAGGVGKAALRLADGEVFQLDEVEVESGMEYSDGTYTFHGNGPEGSVERGGEALLSDCTATGHPQ